MHGVVHDENAAGEGITGHAGLFSTAADLGKLAAEKQARADAGQSKWLSQTVFAEFARPHGLAPNSGRGLGWGIEGGEERTLGHNGFTGTYVRVELSRKMYASCC